MAAPPPTFLNQLTLSDPNSRSDCGETTIAMALQAHGIMDTPLEEISDLGYSGVTGIAALSKLLTDNGATVTGVAASQLPQALADQQTYGLVLIHDNNNADPSPSGPYSHWILAYRLNSDGSIQCANPWGGRNVAYAASTLVASTEWVGLVRWPHVPVPQPGDTPLLMARSVDPKVRYQLDGWGGVHPINGAPAPQITGYWPGWNIARDLDVSEDGTMGVVVDGFGGIHPFGTGGHPAPAYPKGVAYWAGWDIVRQVVVTDWSDPTSLKGYTMDGFGGLHPFGNAPTTSGGCYFANNAV